MPRIMLQVDDGAIEAGEPVQWIDIGRTHKSIEDEIRERFSGRKPEHDEDFLKSINRREMEPHIKDIALTQYCDQFSRVRILPEIAQAVSNLSMVGEELKITVIEVSDADYERWLKSGDEDEVEEDE